MQCQPLSLLRLQCELCLSKYRLAAQLASACIRQAPRSKLFVFWMVKDTQRWQEMSDVQIEQQENMLGIHINEDVDWNLPLQKRPCNSIIDSNYCAVQMMIMTRVPEACPPYRFQRQVQEHNLDPARKLSPTVLAVCQCLSQMPGQQICLGGSNICSVSVIPPMNGMCNQSALGAI